MTTLFEKPDADLCVGPDHDAELAAAHALVVERLGSDAWQKIDALEADMEQLPQQEMPLKHIFVPGAYCRSIFMPKGALLTTRIHLVEHPFVISAGVVAVWTDENGWEILRASHVGVTKPGTRRILHILEDTIWHTFHVTDKTDPDEVVREVTFTGGKFKELGNAKA